MKISEDIQIRVISPSDKTWIIDLVTQRWSTIQVVSRGMVHTVDQLPGYVALILGRRAGLLTYHITEREFEIVTLDSLVEGKGVGTALITVAKEKAIQEKCRRVWLITTNDNLPALRFYQRRGFRISTIHTDALTKSRLLKPEIPLVGMYGIPIRDEIEFELVITH